MFTNTEIWEFATKWYQFLDVHVPVESFRDLITEDAEFVFPEATVNGFDGYAQWYNKVIGIFFDEQHTLKKADIKSQNGNKATLDVLVNWQASVWNPPNASSNRLAMDAVQTWDVVKKDSQILVAKYVVHEMNYEPDTCKL